MINWYKNLIANGEVLNVLDKILKENYIEGYDKSIALLRSNAIEAAKNKQPDIFTHKCKISKFTKAAIAMQSRLFELDKPSDESTILLNSLNYFCKISLSKESTFINDAAEVKLIEEIEKSQVQFAKLAYGAEEIAKIIINAEKNTTLTKDAGVSYLGCQYCAWYFFVILAALTSEEQYPRPIREILNDIVPSLIFSDVDLPGVLEFAEAAEKHYFNNYENKNKIISDWLYTRQDRDSIVPHIFNVLVFVDAKISIITTGPMVIKIIEKTESSSI